MLPAQNAFNQSLSNTEAFSAVLSMRPPTQIIKVLVDGPFPPLWNITEWVVFKTLGTEEIYIRGLSFFYFFLTVIFTYKIGSYLWTRKTGILAAVLTFINPFLFVYALEGTPHSSLALGVTASMYFFLRIILSEKGGKKIHRAGYVVSTLWALYSHHFAIFIVMLQGLWFIFEYFFGNKKSAKKLFKMFIYTGIGYLPWVWPLYNQTKMTGGGFWPGTPDPEDLKAIIYDYLAQGTKQLDYTLPVVKLKLYEVSLYFVYGALLVRRWHKGIKKSVVLLSWFLFPIVATWMISQYFQSIFSSPYLLYTIPGAMLVLASNRRKIFSTVFLGLIMVSFLIINRQYFTSTTKPPFRDLSAHAGETNTEDMLIIWGAEDNHFWQTKYYGLSASIYVENDEPVSLTGKALMEEGDVVTQISEDPKRVGVITSEPVEQLALPGYTKNSIKEFETLKLVWFTKEIEDVNQ